MPVQLNIPEIKAEAKQLLQNASVPPIRFTILFLAINLMLSLISTAIDYFQGGSLELASLSLPFSFVGVLISLLSIVLMAGYTGYCLNVHRGTAMPYVSLFDAFPFAGKVVLLFVLQTLLIALGFILFIVPGVYFAFAYSFAIYHICEEPSLGVIEALHRSRMETNGYKWQLFLLIVSFLPLLLLVGLALSGCELFLSDALPLTLGGELLYTLIAGVLSGCAEAYLMPYMRLAQVGFYRRATEHAEAAPPENDTDDWDPEL